MRWEPLGGPLSAEVAGEGPRIVLVHGFTQTGRSMRPLASRLVAAGHQCAIVDLPGHGGSSGVRADLWTAARLLVATVGDATYAGYSLGGRVCLHVALSSPATVRQLVVLGANPGIDDEAERAARRAADDALADHLTAIGVDAFLDEWTVQPLFAGLELSADERADRLRNTVDGLSGSLRLAGTGVQDSLWSRLADIAVPVLALAGALDAKFVDIGRRIAAASPHGEFVAIPAAGHAAHLQQPAAVAAAIASIRPGKAGEIAPPAI